MSSSGNFKIKRPDVAVRDRKLDTLNVQLKKIDEEIALLRKQIDQNQVNDVTQQERKKLQDQTKEIIKTQADLKTRRNTIHESIKQIDSQIKRKTTEINDKLGKKSKYTSTAEIKQRLAQIEDSISSGDLSLVEEKMLVKEMQSLNKLNKDLVAIEPVKKSIDADKIKITELKEQLNSMNPREVSAKFEDTQKRLNDLQSKTQGVYDKRQALFTKRTVLYKKRDEVYSQIRKIRTDFDNEFKSFKQKMETERIKREEEQKLSKLLEEKDNALGKLQEKLNHSKVPAFTFEIEAIENSLTALDPTYVKPKKALFTDSDDPLNVDNRTAVKQVENDDLVPVAKKDDDVFTNTAPSKSKKFKKKSQNKISAEPASDGKFSLEPTLIATLAELDVSVPISQDSVEKTLQELKAKHEEFVAKQDEQTKINIADVEKEIAQLEINYAAKEEQVKKELEEKRAKEQAEKEANEQADKEN
ncbi:hypothetical protein Kpol_1072p53 [Vanderwaltozyma polyspora DSM 70294]|uniref:Nuclear segregation protein BFR1 n=1 Tax=Vanderwaltozyma polyspora (strain ATCC 22028 / DSM 70294 / BCRC 21397 / CBS 2163 / NBRC 10782 / NRRL Y-8283 / UCD 57-17) TaxID=436907 RepID=A7TKS1_VANPO|nr:uncharacterized protein Kpol_1072p53 [Vanderwaltozyma polyspora DSM 70294]EDO17183.1 hypothetical protein Kpol_1072p53 [Vanderwaltozyma polyspora DSM 70294]